MSERLFTPAHETLLLELLALDTTTPLEANLDTDITVAQGLLSRFAESRGFEVVQISAPAPAVRDTPITPVQVQEAAERFGVAFWDSQPNLVLRLGTLRPLGETLMINAHVDTVSPHLPAEKVDGVYRGRGAVDAQGPAVAVLAGLEAALQCQPKLMDRVQVLAQLVAGEEGGAMGVYGTRALVDSGHIGRLNIFAEPTGGFFFDCSTSSMTAEIVVEGVGSTDDHPERGENATVILGFMSQWLARALDRTARETGSKVCIAGISTGPTHNRVYGTGSLRVNVQYGDPAGAQRMGTALEAAFHSGLSRFAKKLARQWTYRRTAARAEEITRLRWLKRDLPVLRNRDANMEALLSRAGLEREAADETGRYFTCDAMWAQLPGTYTIVFGPGDLVRNGAHTDGEHIAQPELERYADAIRRVALCWARDRADLGGGDS